MHGWSGSNSPDFLTREDLRLLIFGGKGGSGKTTSAAATAIRRARENRDKEILVVSTDPAHSLADSLDRKIGNMSAPIEGMENLFAMEIDANYLAEEFMAKHRETLEEIFSRGVFLDREDISRIFSLSFPGIDEVMSIIKVSKILNKNRFDLVILDTAPTSHTLRMLEMPNQMGQWIEALELMQEKHRYIVTQLIGRYKKDRADTFIKKIARNIQNVKSLLSNSKITEFVPVMTPDPVNIEETEDLIAALGKSGIFVKSLLINRVMTEDGCDFSRSIKRKQSIYLREINRRFSSYQLIPLPLFPGEIRGDEDLEKLFPNPPRRLDSILSIPESTAHIYYLPSLKSAASARTGTFAPFSLSAFLEEGGMGKFIIFGGKGGVGKTSISAAAGIDFARNSPGKKILLFSSDSLNSFSEVFDQTFEGKISRVRGIDNLFVAQRSMLVSMEYLREKYLLDINKIYDKLGGSNIELKFDREILESMLSLTPPGLDEILALYDLVESMREEEFDLYILDTAATGHLLRFLEIPEILRGWLRVIFDILIKYKDTFPSYNILKKLLELSGQIKDVNQIFLDSRQSKFVAITIPEAMGVLEMNRLLENTKRLKIPCDHILINMVIDNSDCNFCREKRESQERYIHEIASRGQDGYNVGKIPYFPGELKGVENLSLFGGLTIQEGMAHKVLDLTRN